jgi:hypothetical protein
MERFPALAWGQASMPTATPLPGGVTAAGAMNGAPGPVDPARIRLDPQPVEEAAPESPLTVLVVGPPQLADALAGDGSPGGSEVERTGDTTKAIDLARALAPDAVVVDGHLVGARELVEALATDPLTELVPVVVLGDFARPEDAGPYMALRPTCGARRCARRSAT